MSRPLRRDARRNRELLVAAAREVFSEKGLDAPLEEIARRAGVSIGTLYNRLPTRMDLVEAAFSGMLDRWAGEAEQVPAAEDPWDGLVQLIVRTCELQSVDHGMTEIRTSALPGAPGLRAARERVGEVFGKVLERAHGPAAAPGPSAWRTWRSPSPPPRRRHRSAAGAAFLLDGIRPQDT
ncbi:TetR/AcrR family transcriptional regulator [Amycolatopsis viridis]|uniref:AcrR family transcriptional regulator n=1 Tax=Amycolatopsis viridis TaxID=185678 RepID=A0ABX0SXM6_9PSEU|nr:helix-turn-helix domain-containing protein [Amycolatopsis viridis]NIH81283.1 AcrR family transcriptional regulator [Amycolatopsis viridis]